MTKLDTAWAIAEIEGFLGATWHLAPIPRGVVYVERPERPSEAELLGRAHVVEQIVERVLPDSLSGPVPLLAGDTRWRYLRELALRAKVSLEREEELRLHLGDGAPKMDAGRLHSWAWESAAPYWRTGHFHQGVQQAAIRVNAEAQAKSGRRDISEVDLFNQLFALDAPKVGAPRLRLMADDGSRTYQNVHRGARALADGLYTAIRNPGAHEIPEQEDEHQSLEQLAAFSLLARWIDQADLRTAD